jgi:hypothetical protein
MYSTVNSADEIDNLFNQQVQVSYCQKFTIFRSSPAIIPGYSKYQSCISLPDSDFVILIQYSRCVSHSYIDIYYNNQHIGPVSEMNFA